MSDDITISTHSDLGPIGRALEAMVLAFGEIPVSEMTAAQTTALSGGLAALRFEAERLNPALVIFPSIKPDALMRLLHKEQP